MPKKRKPSHTRRGRRHLQGKPSSKKQCINLSSNSNSNRAISKSSYTNGDDKTAVRAVGKRLFSNKTQDNLNAVMELRRILSRDAKPPIDEVIACGYIPRLVSLLEVFDSMELLFECLWVLTNICSGTHQHTMTVIEAGGVDAVLRLLDVHNIDVVEQGVWVLGNIAGDGVESRDVCLRKSALERLIELSTEFSDLPIAFRRNYVWSISNLVRGKPGPSWEKTQRVIPVLIEHLRFDDEDILTDTCWALSYLSDGTNERIQAILDHSAILKMNTCRHLVQFLEIQSMSVLIPALRTCGNIVSGDDQQTQHMLNYELLERLVPLLEHERRVVRKEAIWAVSNVTAGNPSQIQAVIDVGLFQPLLHILRDVTVEWDLRKEAIWAISNATTGATDDQLEFLVAAAAEPLGACVAASPKDPQLRMVLLEGLENLLTHGAGRCISTSDHRTNTVVEVMENLGISRVLDRWMMEEEDREEERSAASSSSTASSSGSCSPTAAQMAMNVSMSHVIGTNGNGSVVDHAHSNVKDLAQCLYDEYFDRPFEY